MILPVGLKSKYVKTKIVATIGPATSDESIILKMIRKGMSVARLNFSHGTFEQHRAVIRTIRKISESEDHPVAILQDLSGPKIRLGRLAQPLLLKRSQQIKLYISETPDALFTEFKELVHIVKKGETILINDGYIELKVVSVSPDYVTCRVKVPGIASAGKGINLPHSDIDIPAFTPRDRECLRFGLEEGVDLVAMSFVDKAQAVDPVRQMMAEAKQSLPVIAKVERPVALKNISGIVDAFDGIMVARGDLGVEMPPEQVPIIQKKLIEMANAKNKFVITATQMLESMIENPRPTRAEASDVSNAILDGSDAVMLSGETAVGRYPLKTVEMMRRIARTTEASLLYHPVADKRKGKLEHTEAIVKSAALTARDLQARYIVLFTFSGRTALLMSKYRPSCPVFAFSPQEDVVNRMAGYWGIFPQHIRFSPHTDEMIRRADLRLKEKQLIKQGDLVVTVSGVTPMEGATNMVKVSRFGE